VAYLLAYDRVAPTLDGRRNFKKSTATIYASSAQLATNATEWQLERLATLATVLKLEDQGKQLGVGIGGPAQRASDFCKKTKVVQRMNDQIRQVGGTLAEMVLSQACLGVAKVTHLLRACGDELCEEAGALQTFDRVQDGTLGRLVPGCDNEGQTQASLSVKVGGLGLRRARDTALPAVVASRAMAWPKSAS
jgi:hypothetical protein